MIILDRSILLGQWAIDKLLQIIYFIDTLSDLLLADALILVWLVLVIVHQLIKVGQVGLQGRPRRLHQVLLTGDRLAGACILDLVNLIAKTFNPFLSFSVVALVLISAHNLSLMINYQFL